MAEERIVYKDGYKYQLAETYEVTVAIHPPQDIKTDYIELNNSGHLVLRKGYAWDGPSGPTFDTSNFMRGSLVHDALYQLMRMAILSDELHRNRADKELRRFCLEDGMSSIRAWWVYQAVKHFAGSAANRKNAKTVLYAPDGERTRATA
jgi:hypothetical protein